MRIEVTITKTDYNMPIAELTIDGVVAEFNHHASRFLTNTFNECSEGIFSYNTSEESFFREDTKVDVDFGSPWDYLCENPAMEIKRRIELVEKAFQAVAVSYTKVYTVDI